MFVPRRRSIAVLLALAAAVGLTFDTPASAVEMRLGGLPIVYSAGLVRAATECTAPNGVASNGVAACSPPVTSTACPWSIGKLVVTQPRQIDFPLATASGDPSLTIPAQCRSQYFVDIVTRTSGDFYDPDTLPCPSGHCTFQDFVNRGRGFVDILGLPPLIPAQFTQPIEPNREIVSVAMPGMDGVRLASPGLAPDKGATEVTANLTVPYAPCTLPIGSACDFGPWPAACDYESGRVTWEQPDSRTAPSVHVMLRDVAGSSPLCTTGAYHLETTVRMTFAACGGFFAPTPCTLVDQTYSIPLVPKGRRVDVTTTLPLGDFRLNDHLTTTEILSMRVVDPTGQVIGVPGEGGPSRGLDKLQVVMNGDALRLKATIPIERPDAKIDPAEVGFVLTITDRNSVVYEVTIPALLWQLQTPIGSGWTYDDPGGSIAGVRRIRIKRVGSAGKVKSYKLDLRAAGVDLSAADFPGVTVVIQVSDGTSFLLTPAGRGNRTCIVKGAQRICK